MYENVKSVNHSLKKAPIEERSAIHQFLRCLSVCHSVVVEMDPKTRKRTYQASSPDELALIDGAKSCGYEYQKREMSKITVFNEWKN